MTKLNPDALEAAWATLCHDPKVEYPPLPNWKDCVDREMLGKAVTAYLSAQPEQARTEGWPDAAVKHMVERFLRWRLPENFNPDGGISFKATFNENTPWPSKHEPVGTNLFGYDQAEEMVRFMLEGAPEMPPPDADALLCGDGFVFFNEDSGWEYAENHPVESGECHDAQHIRRSTAQEDHLHKEWQAAYSRAVAPAPRSVEQAAPVEVAGVDLWNKDADSRALGYYYTYAVEMLTQREVFEKSEVAKVIALHAAHIKAQSATIAQLQGEVERLSGIGVDKADAWDRLADEASKRKAAEERADKAERERDGEKEARWKLEAAYRQRDAECSALMSVCSPEQIKRAQSALPPESVGK